MRSCISAPSPVPGSAHTNLNDHFDQLDGWKFVQEFAGMKTYYRGVGSELYVKVVGRSENLSVFNQLAVVREVGMFDKWVPFLSESKLVKKISHLDLVLSFWVKLPFLTRY